MPQRDLFHGTSGPRSAMIAVVGEAWGSEEGLQQRPFVGQSGQEAARMFAEAGIPWESTFRTNLISQHPANNQITQFFEPTERGKANLRGLHPTPEARIEFERLRQQLEVVNPRLIIAAGNYALWAVTNASKIETKIGFRIPTGIMTWRGSMLYSDPGTFATRRTKVLPIIHPAAILRQWYLRQITVHDLKTRVEMALADRWRPSPEPVILAPPTFEQAVARLTHWLNRMERGEKLRLQCDIETKYGLTTCIGFADSPMWAMSIPWVRVLPRGQLDSYWPIKDEAILVHLISQVLMHPNLLLEGQNFLYDIQYIHHEWRILPRLDFDTMGAQHLLFPGTPLGIDYLASLYCKYYWFWKDDGKEWDLNEDLERLLQYNGMDCIRQFEVATVQRELIPAMGLSEQWEWQKRKKALALRMMLRGTLIEKGRRGKLQGDLFRTSEALKAELLRIAPQWMVEDLMGPQKVSWPTSPAQQKILFYQILGLRPQMNRKTKQLTVDDEALQNLHGYHPELSGLFERLSDIRSVNVFHSTFVKPPLDADGRWRSMIKCEGTETFRWSTGKNAFGRGGNMQNIPAGDEHE